MKRQVLSPSRDPSWWSREQLAERISQIEAVPTAGTSTGLRAKRPARPFDFSSYPTRHVALKIAYLGWAYNGFASQQSYKPPEEGGITQVDRGNTEETRTTEMVQPTTTTPSHETRNRKKTLVVTVEDVLFEALVRTRLIESPRTCNYSRCGRTDAGVSSTGQVVALTIRASGKKRTDQEGEDVMVDVPLLRMLNRSLPPDIRVLAWSTVPSSFNARFSCIGRKYKYFFPSCGLDLSRMQQAAAKLVGEHDFRHFCRRDPSRRVQNYFRRILSSHLTALDQQGIMYEYEVHGTAFLYHQVRCIMAILMLVGRGLEPPEVIDYMLDVQRCVKTPHYEIASEVPLVLVECHYPPSTELAWRVEGPEEGAQLMGDFYAMWRDQQARALTLRLLVDPQKVHAQTAFHRAPAHDRIYAPEEEQN